MKKVFLILILFLSCYVIYNSTIDNKIYYLTIGDSISKGINEYGVPSYGYSDFIKDYLYKRKKLKEYNKTYNEYITEYFIPTKTKSLTHTKNKNRNN